MSDDKCGPGGVVVAGGGDNKEPDTRNTDAIAILSEMLKDAWSGKLVGFAAVNVYDEVAGAKITYTFMPGEPINPVLGAIERLSSDLREASKDEA